jgi:hypothetical protein
MVSCEPGPEAQVLPAFQAIGTGPAARKEPCYANPLAWCIAIGTLAALFHYADHLVTGNDRHRREWKIALDGVEIRVAYPTGENLDKNFASFRDRPADLSLLERP